MTHSLSVSFLCVSHSQKTGNDLETTHSLSLSFLCVSHTQKTGNNLETTHSLSVSFLCVSHTQRQAEVKRFEDNHNLRSGGGSKTENVQLDADKGGWPKG